MVQQQPLANKSDDNPPLPGVAGWLFRHVPALDSLRSYSWQALGGDVTAGLTVATVAVPQAMAYATLAGVPPQYGLYTAVVMTAVGALLDSSRQLINGPTNAISIALLSALTVVPEGERVSAAVLSREGEVLFRARKEAVQLVAGLQRVVFPLDAPLDLA